LDGRFALVRHRRGYGKNVRARGRYGRQVMDYSAAKAGVVKMTKTMAKELAPNINVNAVAPGPVSRSSSMAASCSRAG
jgi:NAD(P)-dependent dehydrogenase (short-subunit alcohol dehydrogenase family)